MGTAISTVAWAAREEQVPRLAILTQVAGTAQPFAQGRAHPVR
jgi:hypothetical protein